MSEDQKKQQVEALKELNSKVREQRAALNSLAEEKKKIVAEMHTVRDQAIRLKGTNKGNRTKIRELIEQHKALTASIRELNQQIKDAIETIKGYGAKNGPGHRSPHAELAKINREIERSEQIIETEAISFEKEKRLMDRIKDLKRQSQSLEASMGDLKEYAGLSETINGY